MMAELNTILHYVHVLHAEGVNDMFLVFVNEVQ